MTKLSQEELEAIRARCDAATEGMWDRDSAGQWGNPASVVGGCVKDNGFRRLIADCYTGATFRDKANATFIAHSRTDVPALLSHIEAQAAEIAQKDARIKELEEALGWYCEEVGACHSFGERGHWARQALEDDQGQRAAKALRYGGEDG